ncbi:MAG: hypothetical protein HOM11_04545 [Methylococcales bacterium]|nr:hypothetical protein [Methylococcales bacterium]MBT7442739.1 hypothetical protein [Methylococcales bacterium]
MTSNWNDFNTAEEPQDYSIIPKGELVKVRFDIKPGGYDDPSQNWQGGLATFSERTGAVYLQGEFTVLEGKYAKRKIWSNIGLYSPNGPAWGNMGRSFLKGVLNSAFGVMPQDQSEAAQKKRYVAGIHSLVGMEFVARIDVEKDQYNDHKNVINNAVTPDHKEYAAVRGNINVSVSAHAPVPAQHANVQPVQQIGYSAPSQQVPNRQNW